MLPIIHMLSRGRPCACGGPRTTALPDGNIVAHRQHAAATGDPSSEGTICDFSGLWANLWQRVGRGTVQAAARQVRHDAHTIRARITVTPTQAFRGRNGARKLL